MKKISLPTTEIRKGEKEKRRVGMAGIGWGMLRGEITYETVAIETLRKVLELKKCRTRE